MIHVVDRNGKYIATYEGTTVPETCPEGSYKVDTAPTHQDAVWNGVAWVVPPEFISPDEVNAERDRRIEAGYIADITGVGPVALSGREKDMVNLQGLAFGARLLLDQGDTTTVTPFRDRDDVVHQLTPQQVLEVWQKGSAFVSRMYQIAWTMKDTEIPSDYADDRHWA